MIEKFNEIIFERTKHIDEYGNEYWEARELQKVLEYAQWRRFNEVIERTKISCNMSNLRLNEHFAKYGKPIKGGNGNTQEVLDNMGSEELGANVFRITQTEALLKKQELPSKSKQLLHISK